MSRNILSVFALVGMTVLTAQHAVAGEWKRDGGSLVGTWYTQVTIRECGTTHDLKSFPSLVTFSPGGTLIGTTSAFGPTQRSPDHGAWEQTGRHTFSAIHIAFLFNAAGAWTGIQKITEAIEIKNGKYNSTATTQFFDTAKNLTMSGCAVASATRVEPPDGDEEE
ncbi:MAG TPA: hypothetical protein VH351_07660 [Bryobacteraceae bacterium]|nr:hypothetical protein [Bryobacteraceae bacterium]